MPPLVDFIGCMVQRAFPRSVLTFTIPKVESLAMQLILGLAPRIVPISSIRTDTKQSQHSSRVIRRSHVSIAAFDLAVPRNKSTFTKTKKEIKKKKNVRRFNDITLISSHNYFYTVAYPFRDTGTTVKSSSQTLRTAWLLKAELKKVTLSVACVISPTV